MQNPEVRQVPGERPQRSPGLRRVRPIESGAEVLVLAFEHVERWHLVRARELGFGRGREVDAPGEVTIAQGFELVRLRQSVVGVLADRLEKPMAGLIAGCL